MGPTLPVIQSRSLQSKYTGSNETVFMTGIQALVRLALDQHQADTANGLSTRTFISGYQGSPLGTFDMEVARQKELYAEHGVVFQPGLNEELAATAVMGTQLVESMGIGDLDGVLGLWYGKTPGLDRATDALRHANTIGTTRTGGAVAFVGDDTTAKSSTLPGASEAALFDLEIPFLYPADVQEILDLGLHAVALSRSSGLWSAMKIVTNVADGSATLRVGPGRVTPVMTQPEVGGRPAEHRPSSMLIGQALQELEQTQRYARVQAARRYIAANELNRVTHQGTRDEIGIVAPGKVYLDLIGALKRLGIGERELDELGIRLLKVAAPFPMDPAVVHGFARGLRQIVIVEEKRAFVETAVKDALYSSDDRPSIVGKQDEEGAPLFAANGELGPEIIADVLVPRLRTLQRADRVTIGRAPKEIVDARQEPVPLPVARTPYFCSGCPHNTSTKVPEGTIVGGGIGCSGLIMLMDPKQVGDVTGVTMMGGEGAQWIGMSPFADAEHITQNLGDGTFAHSGSLAIRAAVAADVNITYKILFNTAVAMTGGQAVAGGLTVEKLAGVLLLEGVKRIIVTTEDMDRKRKLPRGVELWDRSRLIEAQELLREIEGVTVLIHDQECAAEKRRKRKRGKLVDPPRRIFINERVCEGCGDCGEKSNCLSVQPVDTEFGRKTRIDQSTCNRDYTCLKGDCPSFLEVIPAQGKAPKAKRAILGEEIPEPARVDQAEFSLRMTGVGGTGIVTIAQILAMAAGFDGWHVRGLDQTGMAQKGGPVVSDLRLTRSADEQSAKLASRDCDLYLGCDLLVAADPANLSVVAPRQTTAVISETEVPTGSMVLDTGVTFPDPGALTSRIADQVGGEAIHTLDAAAVAEALLGSNQSANMVLLGAAYQAGALPISAAAIESAIDLNGAAIDANIQAFRRGRQAVADPEALSAAMADAAPKSASRRRAEQADELSAIVGAEPGSELARVVDRRVAELIAYQDARYGERYARQVEHVRQAETQLGAADSPLAQAVAHNLFKLMAYKDEAEVARLQLDPRLRAEIEAEFGAGARYAWKLHPPILRALGRRDKITLGRWFKPGYKLLYASRRLRGTRLNPFGFGAVRRLERELVDEYFEVVDELITGLEPSNHGLAVEIAALPDMVRGYEHVKLANAAAYRRRLAELRERFATGDGRESAAA